MDLFQPIRSIPHLMPSLFQSDCKEILLFTACLYPIVSDTTWAVPYHSSLPSLSDSEDSIEDDDDDPSLSSFPSILEAQDESEA